MKKLHLSTYISITTTFLVISSTLVTSGILYFSLSKSLTSEFEDRVKAECGEVMQVLANQFRQTENLLRELCQDNTIRVTLMLGVTQQLQEHFRQKYGSKKDTYFFLTPLNSKRVFNASGLKFSPEKLEELLASPAGLGNLEKTEQYGFVYSLSHPIFRQKNQIGTAASIYILNNDENLLRYVSKSKTNTIIKVKGELAWDLLSGKKIKGFNPLIGTIAEDELSYFELNQKRIVAVKKKSFPDLIYISGLDRLDKAKNKVLTPVLYSSLAVLLFTITISLFLSRLLVSPLSQLSRQSLEMADGKSDLSLKTICSNVIEFEQLMSSLSTMVNNLRKTEELKRYQQLFEGVTDPVFIYDFSSNFMEVNQIALDQFGFTKKEFNHMHLLDIIPEKQHKRILKVMQDLSQKGGRLFFETEISTKENKPVYVECHARKIIFREQEVVLSVVRDITDRKKAEEALMRTEQALRENEERYRTILDNRNIGYFEVDLNGDLIFFNDALCDLTGYSREELLGKNYSSYIDKETSINIKNKYNSIFKTGRPVKQLEYAIVKKNNDSRMVETSVSLIKDTQGLGVGFRGLTIDITDRKIAEQKKKKLEIKLSQAHKMEAIGTLAGGIAHDFNNILSGIFGYSQLAEMSIKNPVKAKSHIKQIIKGAKRAADLIKQILTFSRRTEHEKYLLNISNVVKEALKLLRSSIPSTIEIRENVISDARVLADPTQIHQVIMNLCTNAYHAMRAMGGILTVELNEIEIFDQNSIPDLNILPGSYLKLSVRDTGQGMDKETLTKVFDPYFTTKEVGEGTGLGLALVYGIVEEHRGYVKAHSVQGEGSAFHVLFPITHEKAISKDQINQTKPLTGGSESIMVVDDEESILTSTRELLKDYGYQVTTFSNGAQAMVAFNKSPYQFDLVITDMTMPQLTGDKLAARILKIRNGLPIILCSGYSENISEAKAIKLGIKKYIQKPIDSQSLILLIRQILDGNMATP